ncbi:MAG: chromosomal replication initiator protein DnaA [Alphaproteobacteria bacterium]|nr:chromosomal replication initiator protein DnaA [Alphaproteobacteria bacterium]
MTTDNTRQIDDCIQLWGEILEIVKYDLGKRVYNTWFKQMQFIGFEDKVITVTVPSNFLRDFVSAKYSDYLLSVFNSHGFAAQSIRILTLDNNTPETIANSDIKQDTIIKFEEVKTSKSDNEQQEENDVNRNFRFNLNTISSLDKKLTFENFVVGRPNEFAYAAARRVAESDTPPFNPLFLYGGVGLGKTHLMHSIAWHIKETQPQKKVIYISAEKFMYLFIRALRVKDAMSFKELFRNVDVLMVDDVQFIGGKDTTQEEFFHTFNDLVDNNRQIIISADKSPSELEGVEARLKSRLGWGLVADIHPTTYELRLGILQEKVKKFKMKIPRDVIDFLAVSITSNVRELEGALNRVVAHSTLVGREVSIEMVNEVLTDVLNANKKFITIDLIQRSVCEFYRVKLSDLNSSKRIKTLVTARQVAMYLSKELTTKSLPDIGRSFGGRDHTTVLYATKKVKDQMEVNQEFKSDVEILKKALEG